PMDSVSPSPDQKKGASKRSRCSCTIPFSTVLFDGHFARPEGRAGTLSEDELAKVKHHSLQFPPQMELPIAPRPSPTIEVIIAVRPLSSGPSPGRRGEREGLKSQEV